MTLSNTGPAIIDILKEIKTSNVDHTSFGAG